MGRSNKLKNAVRQVINGDRPTSPPVENDAKDETTRARTRSATATIPDGDDDRPTRTQTRGNTRTTDDKGSITKPAGSSTAAPGTGGKDKGNEKGSSSFSAISTIYLTTFPPDFPVHTPEPIDPHHGQRGYLFIEGRQILDSFLIFITIFSTFLLLTITCIKCNSIFTKSKQEKKGKIDNVIMEDMKWAEGREVIERRIVWERDSKINAKGEGRRSVLGLGVRGGGRGGRGRSSGMKRS